MSEGYIKSIAMIKMRNTHIIMHAYEKYFWIVMQYYQQKYDIYLFGTYKKNKKGCLHEELPYLQ